MRILNAEPAGYSEQARQILRSVAELHEEEFDRQQLIARLGSFEVLIVRLGQQVDAELLAHGRQLLAIVTATTGLDHIDLKAAAAASIAVLSLRGESAFLRTVTATAEHTWALLLSLLRKIPQAANHVAAGGWQRDRFRGRELAGRRLGIVGLGRLGQMVARYGLAFSMRVEAYDPAPVEAPPGVRLRTSLESLLPHCDVLSLHAPLDELTAGMIGAEQLALLPTGAVLVNTARGDLIDGQALLAGLRDGRLAGAALDVVPGERQAEDPTRQALIDLAAENSKLLITPHIGGATLDSMRKTEIFMAQKLARWIADQPPARSAS